MRTFSHLIAITSFLIASQLASAQELAPEHGLKEVTGRSVGSVKDRTNPLSGVELHAGKGDDEVTLKLSTIMSKPKPGKDKDEEYLHFDTASVTFSTPLDKKSARTDLISLDGLATSSSIEFSFTRFTAAWRPGQKSDLPARDAICKAIWKTIDPDVKHVTATGEQEGCGSVQVAKGTPEQQRAWEQLNFTTDDSTRWTWGVNGKIGFPSFDYVDPTTLQTSSRNEKPWSLGGFVALNPDAQLLIYSLGLNYQKSYTAGKDGVLCPVPATGATSVTCASGAIGAPTSSTKKLMSFDMRRAFNDSNTAIALTITHDFAKPATSVELPIYLIKNAEGILNGGLKFGWRSDTKQYGASVFVGSNFAINQ